VILLALAAGLFALLWLTEVAGDPTEGVAFYMLAFTTPLLVGIAMVIAASRRRDLFGTGGMTGCILVLAGGLWPGIIGYAAAVVGLMLVAVSLWERARTVLFGVVVLLGGAVGLLLRLESGDGLLIFLPVLAVGAAMLATTLRSQGE
jgi:hypothetical protein